MSPRWLTLTGPTSIALTSIALASIALALLTACASQPARKPPPGDPFVVAQDQALALGKVLAGIRLCEGVAWQMPLDEFMAVKRQRGLDDIQTAMIAAMTGAGEAQAEPEMLECSPDGAARRQAAITEMRAVW